MTVAIHGELAAAASAVAPFADAAPIDDADTLRVTIPVDRARG